MPFTVQSKDELLKILGKPAWGDNRLLSKVSYLSGVDAFDDVLKGEKNVEGTSSINLIQCPLGLQIQLTRMFKSYSIAILPDQIEMIELEDKGQDYTQKDKSVIGRAIIGGLLLGPLGAVVGGMSGIGAKEVKVDSQRLLLAISLRIANEERILSFSCKIKNRPEVDKFFSSYYKDKLPGNS
jgi:hypothetical protein